MTVPPPPIPPQYGATPPPTNTAATTALVLAIISFACCGLFTSLPGIFFAMSGKKQAQLTGVGGSVAQVAFILCIINIVLSGLGLLYYMALWAFSV